MRGSGGGSGRCEETYVLDASGLFHLRHGSILKGRFLTTNYVLEEVKDCRSVALLDVLRVEVVEVEEGEVEEVRSRHPQLSQADASIVALVRRLGCATVVTDDVALSKVLRRYGAKVLRVFYGGGPRPKRPKV